MDFEELYQEVILDHSRRPRNYGEMADATAHIHANNPMCGDDITVHTKLSPTDLEAISFTGNGCSICIASASLMTVKLKKKSRDDALKLLDRLVGLPCHEVGASARVRNTRREEAWAIGRRRPQQFDGLGCLTMIEGDRRVYPGGIKGMHPLVVGPLLGDFREECLRALLLANRSEANRDLLLDGIARENSVFGVSVSLPRRSADASGQCVGVDS